MAYIIYTYPRKQSAPLLPETAAIATPYGVTAPPMAQATAVYDDNYVPTGLGGVPLDAYQGQHGKMVMEPSCPPAV